MIYLIILLYLVALAIIFDLYRLKTARLTAQCLSLFILVCLAGFRFRVGGDTTVYMSEYEEYISLINVSSLNYFFDFYGRQPGWVFLLTFLKTFSDSFYFVQFVVALFFNIAVFSFFNRYIPKYFFSSILLYFSILFSNLNFEVMRESVAIGFFLLNTVNLNKRAWIRYYLVAILAFFFHEASIVTFVVPFIQNFKINNFSLAIFGFLLLSLIMFSDVFVKQVYDIAMGSAGISNKAFYYFNSELYEPKEGIGFVINLFVSVLMPLYVIYRSSRAGQTQKYDIIVLAGLLLYTISFYIPIFYRFNNYFYFFTLLIYLRMFLNLASEFRNSKLKNLAYMLCLVCFVVFKLRIYFTINHTNNPNYVKYYPYYSIFDEKTSAEREAAVTF